MTYGDTETFVKEFLRGDNSNAVIFPTHYKMAIMEIASLCEPNALKVEFDGTQTDILRLLNKEEIDIDDELVEVQYYIKTPEVPNTIDANEELPVDQQLGLAVVFYVCSYLSNKYTDRYEKKAEKQVSIYVSNEVV